MLSIFPEPILNLPEADIPLDGVKAYLFQGENYQIILTTSPRLCALFKYTRAFPNIILLSSMIILKEAYLSTFWGNFCVKIKKLYKYIYYINSYSR